MEPLQAVIGLPNFNQANALAPDTGQFYRARYFRRCQDSEPDRGEKGSERASAPLGLVSSLTMSSRLNRQLTTPVSPCQSRSDV